MNLSLKIFYSNIKEKLNVSEIREIYVFDARR